MKTMLILGVLAGLTATLPVTASAADSATVVPQNEVHGATAASEGLNSKFPLKASLYGRTAGVYWPMLAASMKNNSGQWLEASYTGPEDFSFVVDYLPEGQDPALSTGWLHLLARKPVANPTPNGEDGEAAGFDQALMFEPGRTIPVVISPSDYGPLGVGLTTPGYYRITITMTVARGWLFDNSSFSGPRQLISLKFAFPPLIIHRTAIGFAPWPPTAKPK